MMLSFYNRNLHSWKVFHFILKNSEKIILHPHYKYGNDSEGAADEAKQLMLLQ